MCAAGEGRAGVGVGGPGGHGLDGHAVELPPLARLLLLLRRHVDRRVQQRRGPGAPLPGVRVKAAAAAPALSAYEPRDTLG